MEEQLFNICRIENCGIRITGLELEGNKYLSNSEALLNNKYPYNLSITLNVMVPIKYPNIKTTYIQKITEHIDGEVDVVTMQFPLDGLYEIYHIIIPTIEWYNAAKEQVTFLEHTYIYDEYNKIKKINGEELKEISVLELIEATNTVDNSTMAIIKSQTLTFCTCRLQECFYKNSREYFNKLCLNSCTKQDLVNKDILWIGLNTINYLKDLGRYYEAQHVLETLTGCAGICSNTTVNKTDFYGCGCSN